jgi:hypothetical protein
VCGVVVLLQEHEHFAIHTVGKIKSIQVLKEVSFTENFKAKYPFVKEHIKMGKACTICKSLFTIE